MTGHLRARFVAARSIAGRPSCHSWYSLAAAGPAGAVDGAGAGAGVVAVDTDLPTPSALRGLAGNAGIQYLDDD